jgi:hypothetical protein
MHSVGCAPTRMVLRLSTFAAIAGCGDEEGRNMVEPLHPNLSELTQAVSFSPDNIDSVLVCPDCGATKLRPTRADVVGREGARERGVQIYFACEDVHCLPGPKVMAIRQHKGVTLMQWQAAPAKERVEIE